MGSLLKITILCLLLACTLESKGQFYLGLSANLGNRLKYTSSSPGLQNPPRISGSIIGIYNEELKNNWALQYGGALGVLGYNMKVTTLDTLTTAEQIPDSFLEYSTFFGRFSLTMGKTIYVGKKELMIGLGGGISYYYSVFTEMSYSMSRIMDDGSVATTFSADFDSPQTSILGFAKIATQLKFNDRLTFGLEYSHSFKSILNGTYEFYHTEVPSSGSVSLYPRELSLVFAVNTSKQVSAKEKLKKEIREKQREGKYKTYLGFDLAIANDIYKINDSGDYLESVPLYNVTWGFNIRQGLSEKFFIETGFIVKFYQEGFGFKAMPFYSTTSSDASWLIPIRGGMNVNIYKQKLFLVPVIGYTFGINPPFGYGWGYGKQESNAISIVYNTMENEDVNRYFSLLQFGAGLSSRPLKTHFHG